ncbi:HPP family protein [Strigomonas culicis]|uniref:HPP family protein n=1 Tax=Strigomonas culicis TaxID=28005 RepID=S9UWL8_9TRYP|nr:HPP family protein [Strigomonas culicis]|eukprot:EPY35282.1 HPP family protein [Strigomonas culicis]
MVVLALVDHYGFYHLAGHSVAVFLPALGATCTVIYAVPKAPIAQPRCVIFSHVSAAVIGTALTHAFRSVSHPPQPFGSHCAGALGVAIHLALMIVTNTLHPPASATVISAAVQTLNAYYQDGGFLFVVTPCLLGPLIVVVMAIVLNNLVPSRSPYPQFW